MIEVVKATPLHVVRIIDHLTEASRRELEAFGKDVTVTLLGGVEKAASYVALADGFPVAMAGGAWNSEEATVWMVVTNRAKHYPKSLLRRCREVLDALLGEGLAIHTFVDSRNTEGLRWVRALGFTLSLPLYERGDAYFHRADLRR